MKTQVEDQIRCQFIPELDQGQWFGCNTRNQKLDKVKAISDTVLLYIPKIDIERVILYYQKVNNSISLNSFPLFTKLSKDSQKSLEKICIPFYTRNNQKIVKEGSEPKSIFIIQKGEFELSKKIYHQKDDENTLFQTKRIHNMSVNERRENLRKSLFKKLCLTHTKPAYSKQPLWVKSNGTILCTEAVFQENKIKYSVIWKSFEGLLYKINIFELHKLFENKEIHDLFKGICGKEEESIQTKIKEAKSSAPSRNNPWFMKTIKVVVKHLIPLE